ncbi:ABC transporter permease [Dyella acidisoli]|uniref:ABC transporter ATP-binding protein n=1 Tax=Dyella acidisoli TaxID=1867834 RepID=A0ABQ5XMS4_9GAMM|nr:ABC transporter permease [Dyella acidisoli]GLQ92312.1 ABC transporter ATP-binding protein [Dyella acidisoli]
MFGYYLDMAIRSLKHNKVLTVLMVLAIGVGIGASMTTLTVMHLLSGDPLPGKSATLFRPLVDPDPTPERTHETPMDVMDYRSAMDLWSAHRADRQTLVVQSPVKVVAAATNVPPLMLMLLSTTTDFFPMFDVPFQYGSGWTADDDERRSRVAVISASLNDKLFGGANSVGRTLHLRNTDVRIIGVLKPWRPSPLFYMVAGGRFAHGDTADFYGKPEDVFVPFSSSLEINDGNFQQFTCWALPKIPGHLIDAPCEWVTVWVQLGDAGKAAAYRRFLADYAAQQKSLGRFTHAENTRLPNLMEWLDYNGVVPSDVHLQTWLAFAFLAICLFNTIGLLLAKFLRRGGEIGVRRALGATRGAIFAQFLMETALVGVLGGVLGWLLTLAGLSLVRRQPTPYADMVHLDVLMFATTFALSIAVSLLAGALPAFRASRVAPALQLKTQ